MTKEERESAADDGSEAQAVRPERATPRRQGTGTKACMLKHICYQVGRSIFTIGV